MCNLLLESWMDSKRTYHKNILPLKLPPFPYHCKTTFTTLMQKLQVFDRELGSRSIISLNVDIDYGPLGFFSGNSGTHGCKI